MITLITMASYTVLNMVSYKFFNQNVIPDLDLIDHFIFAVAIITDILGLITKIKLTTKLIRNV